MGCIESNGRYQVFRYQAVRESHLGNFLVWWSPLETRDTAPQLSRLIYVGICLKEKLHCSLNMLTFSLYRCSRLLRFSIVVLSEASYGKTSKQIKLLSATASTNLKQNKPSDAIQCDGLASQRWIGCDLMVGDGCGQ